jgi:hypothetical protein
MASEPIRYVSVDSHPLSPLHLHGNAPRHYKLKLLNAHRLSCLDMGHIIPQVLDLISMRINNQAFQCGYIAFWSVILARYKLEKAFKKQGIFRKLTAACKLKALTLAPPANQAQKSCSMLFRLG